MKTYTWNDLKKVVRNSENNALSNFIRLFPERQRMLAALALSVAHWMPSEREYVWKGKHVYRDKCGLCSLHACSWDCDPCPLAKSGMSCVMPHSIWSILERSTTAKHKDRETYNALSELLYKRLCGLYLAEWNSL